MYIGSRAKKKVFQTISEFLLDAAVLVFVFPVLDSLAQFGTRALTRSLVGWSIGISFLFLGLALIMAVASERAGDVA